MGIDEGFHRMLEGLRQADEARDQMFKALQQHDEGRDEVLRGLQEMWDGRLDLMQEIKLLRQDHESTRLEMRETIASLQRQIQELLRRRNGGK